VRDEKNGATLGLELGDDPEQVVDLAGRQGRGRLVHDDDPRVVGERARNFDQVLLGDAERLEGRVGVDVAFEPQQEVARAGTHCAPVHQPAASDRHVPHENVLGHRQLIEHHRLLVDGGDARGPGISRAREGDGPTLHQDLPVVGPVEAGQDFDYRRFAGAVLADEGHDLPGPQGEARLVKGPDTGKALRNT
jgi:hypothetical protein